MMEEGSILVRDGGGGSGEILGELGRHKQIKMKAPAYPGYNGIIKLAKTIIHSSD